MTVTPGMDLFDGFMMRGMVDRATKCSKGTACDVIFDVTFSDNTTASHTFTTVDNSGDFRAIGFDETPGTVGLLVSQVVVSVSSGENFDQIKQMGFSVPGATPTIPETSTWGMLLLGFAGLGYAGLRRGQKDSVSALA